MTRTNLGVSLCASEVFVLFTIRLYCPTFTICMLPTELIGVRNTFISWAYTNSGDVPAFADTVTRKVMISRLLSWKQIERFVGANGPMRPVCQFRHGLQAAHSCSNGGVDCAAQYRLERNSSGTSHGWEHKVLINLLNKILVKTFTVWHMLRNEHMLQTRDVLDSLDRFRDRINQTSSVAD